MIKWLNDGTHLIIVYIIINFITFIMYAIDKHKAKKHKWRISENALIIAAVFGIFGGFCGMYIMHHKTKKPKFYIGLPVILVLEIAALIFIYLKIHNIS